MLYRAWVVPAFQQAMDHPDYQAKDPNESEQYVFPEEKQELLSNIKKGTPKDLVSEH
jgi:hypothetical protein